VEDDARVLCQPDEGRRPVRAPRPTASTRTWRCSSRASAACGSTPRSPLPSSPTRRNSTVADKVGYALAPDNGLGKRGNWLWAWSLAIPAGSQKAAAAQKFISWATSKAYLELVASKEGWANVPPGTRTSLYNNPEYQKAAPFAKMTLDSINAADPTKPTVKPVPYVGVQFVAIPEFQGLATTVGQLFSAALAGQMSVDDALSRRSRRSAK
jgi:sorbitol/mannitol transport system substrate-binding protein